MPLSQTPLFSVLYIILMLIRNAKPNSNLVLLEKWAKYFTLFILFDRKKFSPFFLGGGLVVDGSGKCSLPRLLDF